MARASSVPQSDVALGGRLNISRGAFDGVVLAYLLGIAKRGEISKVA